MVTGLLRKFSVFNFIAIMRSSVGLGPQINPTPSLASAGQVPAVNAAGDAYELVQPGAAGSNPVPVADDAGKLPLVNTAEDGYTLSTLPYVPVPPPVDDQIIIGSGPLWTTTRLPQRSDSYPHVSRIPAALASSAPLVYLEHEYHEGGSRVDATLRISGDGVLAGYIDPRLGTRLGSINQASPVVRIRVILTGDTISRWDDIEFFEEETATEFTHIWLADSQYNLGPPYFARGLWHRQFDTEPLALQIDTDIAFNLRRSDLSFFHTDGLGIRFEAGFWQLFQVRQGGQYKYGHLGGPGIVHTRSVGEPLDEPNRQGNSMSIT